MTKQDDDYAYDELLLKGTKVEDLTNDELVNACYTSGWRGGMYSGDDDGFAEPIVAELKRRLANGVVK